MLLNPYRFAAAGGGGAGHLYWRINAIDVPSTLLEISEIRVFDGAVDVTAAATKTSSHAVLGGVFLNLFDGNLNNNAYWQSSVVEAGAFWIQFLFAAGTAINGVKQGGFDDGSRYMQGFSLQYSDDGSAWTTLGTKSGLAYPGPNTLSVLYTFP